MMIKKITRVISIIFAISLFALCTANVYAFEDKEHDEYLEKVLFGSANFKTNKPDTIKEKIKILEYASYLSIDQYNAAQHPNDIEKLNYLKKKDIPDIPELSDIDFQGNQYHRRFTHRGWDFDYTSVGKDKANWPVRKNMLINAVNNVCDFGFFSKKFLWFDIDKKCKSFAALVYYVHVLGDHIDNKWEKRSVGYAMIHLADAHDKNNSLTKDLKYHLGILFDDQDGSNKYNQLINEIDLIENRAEAVISSSGGILTEEKFNIYHQCAVDLMDLLIERVPTLLKNESFFANVFYNE